MNVNDFLSECWEENLGPIELLCSDCLLLNAVGFRHLRCGLISYLGFSQFWI